VDNLPGILIEDVLQVAEDEGHYKVAFGIDVRDANHIPKVPGLIDTLLKKGHQVKVNFLDSGDEFLVRRFSETRRQHPMAKDGDLLSAITRERHLLEPIRQRATKIIDTSGLTIHELRKYINDFIGKNSSNGSDIAISLVSFGFKNGLLAQADLIFDVRFLPNPYFVPELSPKSGLDDDVFHYVMDNPKTVEFFEHLSKLLLFLIPQYIAEGKSYLTIGIGCTGGKHRSVSIVRALNKMLLEHGYQNVMRHRDLPKSVNKAAEVSG
jgi:UPF0042 nucleotide-binding protein